MYRANLYKNFPTTVNMLVILLALTSILLLSACAVPVKDADTSHPANPNAIVTPVMPMSKTLSAEPVEKSKEPMMNMDHSMHQMNH